MGPLYVKSIWYDSFPCTEKKAWLKDVWYNKAQKMLKFTFNALIQQL